MTRLTHLRPLFVEFIPDQLEPGVLYISHRYSTASHLCCCGCGHEVVTPLNAAKWRMKEDAGAVSLIPSVGNWSFPCRSHYWIKANRVQWAAAMAPKLIQSIQARDRHDAANYVPRYTRWGTRVYEGISALASLVARHARSWLQRF